MYFNVNRNFTCHEVRAFTTQVYPYAIYVPGIEMTMGIMGATLTLCTGDEFIIWDGAAWLSPMAIFFEREKDFEAMVEFMTEWQVNHVVAHHQKPHRIPYNELIRQMEAQHIEERFH